MFNNIANQLIEKYKNLKISQYKNQPSLQDANKMQQLLQNNVFARQIVGLSQSLCLKYDRNPDWYSIVMDTIDLSKIYSNVENIPQESQSSGETKEDLDYEATLVKELLRYFKEDFFTWCDKPICLTCGTKEHQVFKCTKSPNNLEKSGDPGCSVVEVYECNVCHGLTRFPRYNNPIKLLETRTGRCGEWCNLFMLFLKSFGLKSRYIWNKEDHVWCEYYSDKEKRWIHLDPCEKSYDEPFIYSRNWNKKMSYVFAFGNDGVVDVSKRYIVESKNQLPRKDIDETDLKFLFQQLTKSLRRGLNDEELYRLGCRDELEKLELGGYSRTTEKNTTSTTDTVGRISGSADWKSSRGEDGGATE
ncbi:related to Peptide-N(4)-(N-acetyl-beta-glucosaminyl)asparagine amidase [Saccharomycodes ludwigii]|uniref:Peptide-N(4)-(N-acetyl-beta-glucosaminyl)asparagine amidase n=1 Tax=Saccharomycodes ludwigii TaxID=36035 RepID=A0A376BA01_9ASCO|nr:hypothetical protein SCDLUD_002046 [Saccharomycodes ludwigii]KAH3902229.1 hypothetical protein SCDLUD_002046 [Saccharomycodes ludwigii]SSD61482.1 related to Peptide-N(4)-(N-acetyl-beta-glucosaminyl)asparagine amidase [Saccharomycodes ludwigii]